jgi:hypothetical protein
MQAPYMLAVRFQTDALKKRFDQAKSYNIASSIALIHFLQTVGSLDLLVIYHTFCLRAAAVLIFKTQ